MEVRWVADIKGTAARPSGARYLHTVVTRVGTVMSIHALIS